MENKSFNHMLIVISLLIFVAVGIREYRDNLEEQQHQEEHAEEDLKRLFYILRAAEDGHANYISYEVPQADPFTRAQRVEYFNACGYAVVGEGREGRFIVEKIGWRDAAGENKP